MKEKKICSIYCFTNKVNNKQYIGSTTVNVKTRYNQHLYNAKTPSSNKYYYPLYQAIRKYGIENFDFQVLYQEECEEQKIRQIEHQYIIQYNTLSPKGYNQTDNTEHPSQDLEIQKKISKTKRENAKSVVEVDKNNNIIQTWKSIIDCAEDIKLDERKIAAVCRGERKTTGGKIFRWIENGKLIIPVYSRDAYKGAQGTTQIQSSNRKIAKIDLKTNQILEIYPTIALAARENNCDNSAISKVCRGHRNKCGGFGWKYIDE